MTSNYKKFDKEINSYLKRVFLIAVLLFSATCLFAADPYTEKRQAMVENDIKGRGIKDKKVIEVMGKIPRHLLMQ